MNSAAEDASSALPPMGQHDDDLTTTEDDDAVAFAVAAVQHGEGMMLDVDDLDDSHLEEEEPHNLDRRESLVAAYGASSASSSPDKSRHHDAGLDARSLPELVPGIRLRPEPPRQSVRDRRVGKTNRQRHQELLEAAAALSDMDPLAMAIAGVVHSSKHDEKWNAMFQKLLDYKHEHGNTLIPQCYHDDPKLGRWVHYQRVEYWLFQSSGKAKITPERIQKLNAIHFEWDPQREKWNGNYEKLLVFHRDHGHCRVPKNWSKDPELANWVRNQRLEYASRQKNGRKSRMTQERIDQLNHLGFTWSQSTPNSATTVNAGTSTSDGPRKRQKTGSGREADATKENDMAENEVDGFADATILDEMTV